MKVVSVKIHNILGIEDFEITPKEINRFEGKNATGKTSTLEAIKAALKGGHDATLLRNGADEGQVVILLDDGLEIKKTVTNEKTDLSVKYPRSGVKIEKPQTHINALIDALSINPVEFLSAPASKRAEYLLQAMPLKVTREDLKDIYPKLDAEINAEINLEAHAFMVLAAVEKMIYDERTGVNRLKDEKQKTAKQLGETLPLEEDPTDWAKMVADTQTELSEAKTELKNAKDKAESTHKNMLQGIDICRKDGLQKITDQYNDELAKLNAWRANENAKILAEEKKAIEEEAARDKTALEVINARLAGKIENLTAGLSKAQTNAKAQTVHENTRNMITQHENEAMKHEADSKALTDRLARLDALRLRILSNLPIHGVTVENGQVMKDGVTYDRLNTAQQIAIAVAIAKIRSKDLGIVCVDGLECLDEENFQAFETAMQGSGLQCFITRVTNTPMEVTTK